MLVTIKQLLPSARNALQRVENARSTGIIHTDVWVRELSAYAPETSIELEQMLGGRLRVHSYLQSETARPPVLYIPSPNPYAMGLEEFSGAARYAAEALQRGVHLVDPHCSIADLIANLPSISNTGVILMVEGSRAMIKAVGVLETDLAAQIPALICIHPGEIPDPRSVPVYRVDENPGASGWAGMPSTPLAIARWIPEVCTYLDAIRPWLDLRG